MIVVRAKGIDIPFEGLGVRHVVADDEVEHTALVRGKQYGDLHQDQRSIRVHGHDIAELIIGNNGLMAEARLALGRGDNQITHADQLIIQVIFIPLPLGSQHRVCGGLHRLVHQVEGDILR